MCWFLYAFQVFSMRVATVIGPTPPGEGEIARTKFSRLSKSASPQNFPFSSIFEPTSIIIAFLLTISRVKNFGLPTAAITTSAILVISLRFFVWLLQLITVAPALIIMSAIGFPTIFDRPRIATFLPLISILYASRSVIIPCGVQLGSHFFPRKTFPICVVVNPSTSLCAGIFSIIFSSLMCFGSGIWTINPLISGFSASFSISCRSSASEMLASKFFNKKFIPTSSARFRFILIYCRLAGLSPTRITARQGNVRFFVAKSAFKISDFTESKSSFAIFFPSRIIVRIIFFIIIIFYFSARKNFLMLFLCPTQQNVFWCFDGFQRDSERSFQIFQNFCFLIFSHFLVQNSFSLLAGFGANRQTHVLRFVSSAMPWIRLRTENRERSWEIFWCSIWKMNHVSKNTAECAKIVSINAIGILSKILQKLYLRKTIQNREFIKNLRIPAFHKISEKMHDFLRLKSWFIRHLWATIIRHQLATRIMILPHNADIFLLQKVFLMCIERHDIFKTLIVRYHFFLYVKFFDTIFPFVMGLRDMLADSYLQKIKFFRLNSFLNYI